MPRTTVLAPVQIIFCKQLLGRALLNQVTKSNSRYSTCTGKSVSGHELMAGATGLHTNWNGGGVQSGPSVCRDIT